MSYIEFIEKDNQTEVHETTAANNPTSQENRVSQTYFYPSPYPSHYWALMPISTQNTLPISGMVVPNVVSPPRPSVNQGRPSRDLCTLTPNEDACHFGRAMREHGMGVPRVPPSQQSSAIIGWLSPEESNTTLGYGYSSYDPNW